MRQEASGWKTLAPSRLETHNILQLDDIEPVAAGTPISPGFAETCKTLAGQRERGSWSVARNGTIIEQAQILTTHNLASLYVGLKLASAMRRKFHELAHRCFLWICKRQQMKINDWRAQLRMMKNTAYAWRQMIFYLSLIDRWDMNAFLEWSDRHFEDQRPDFRRRFKPVIEGLRVLANGEQFGSDGQHHPSGGRRFLGWTVGKHWLLPTEVPSS